MSRTRVTVYFDDDTLAFLDRERSKAKRKSRGASLSSLVNEYVRAAMRKQKKRNKR